MSSGESSKRDTGAKRSDSHCAVLAVYTGDTAPGGGRVVDPHSIHDECTKKPQGMETNDLGLDRYVLSTVKKRITIFVRKNIGKAMVKAVSTACEVRTMPTIEQVLSMV